MNREQLVEAGKHYFDNPKVELMYATPDKNFFHESGHNHALNHATRCKSQLFTITRADYADGKSMKEADVETLRSMADKAGYDSEEWVDLTQKNLVKYLQDKAKESAKEAVDNKAAEAKVKEEEAKGAKADAKLEEMATAAGISKEDLKAYNTETGKSGVVNNRVTNGFKAWKKAK